MRLIQPVMEFIVSPLTHIINSCIKNNVFPQTWKIARISPIPKTDNPSESNDYRPVAILPILSKVTKVWYCDKCKSLLTGHAVYGHSDRV